MSVSTFPNKVVKGTNFGSTFPHKGVKNLAVPFLINL